MTRNLFGWDQRFQDRAARRAERTREFDLLEQGERQRKDWRFGLFGEPKRAADLKPEERAAGAICQCEWCQPPTTGGEDAN